MPDEGDIANDRAEMLKEQAFGQKTSTIIYGQVFKLP